MKLKFKKLHPKAKLPTRGTDGAAGYDLYLAEDIILTDREEDLPHMVNFGLAVEIPEGYFGILCERSSTHKLEVSQINKIGIIDSDYRGELKAPYWDTKNYFISSGDYQYTDDYDCAVWGRTLKAGERIAQLVIVPCFMAEPEWTEELSDTARGVGSFGSTGS